MATRDAFVAQSGAVEALCGVFQAHAAEAPLLCAAAEVVRTAAAGHEGAKVALYKAGAAAHLLAALRAFPEDVCTAASACFAVSALASADDRRVAASAAFTHGRLLHKAGALSVLLAALERHRGSPPAVDAACCALRAVAVNDEACAEVADAGGVELLVSLLCASQALSAKPLCSMLNLLRQLAGADVVKGRFHAAGGLPVLAQLLALQQGAAWAGAVTEAVLALLSALSLRTPELVAAAAAAGCCEAALDAMAAHPSSPRLQRAACMFLRNCAARNPELRAPLCERGAEDLLRAAKVAHPSLCNDVGSAALRDLGAADYNQGWTPTTVYMGAEGQLYTWDDLGDADDAGA